MKGSDFLQQLLGVYGIKDVYGVLGREAASILFNKEHSQRFLLFRNELSAGTAAIAASRLSGMPQVCFSTLGPGVTHMMTAIATATQDRNPILFISAQLESPAIDYNNAHQCLNAVGITQPLVKYNDEPRDLGQLAVAVDRAFSSMMTYPFGPTFLSVPIDVLDAQVTPELIAKWLSRKKNCTPRLTTSSAEQLEKDIKQATQIIQESKNPIIVLGDTAAKIPEAKKLKELIEQLNIPSIATYAAKGILPPYHPLNLGAINSYLDVILEEKILQNVFEEADAIVLLGYDMIEHYPNAWKFGDQKKIISITTFDNHTNKSFIPDVKVTGDLFACLHDITSSISDKRIVAQPAANAIELIMNKIKDHLEDSTVYRGVSVPQVVQTLTSVYGDDYIVANDIGMHRHAVGTYFMPQEPHFYLTSAGLSSFGTGIGMSIGASLTRPDKRTVLIAGDGGFHSNSGDLETIVRHKLPITVIVLTNNANGLIKRYQLTGAEKEQDTSATEFMDIDFAKLAEANGMKGYCVKSAEELLKTLRDNKNSDESFLVEVPVFYPDLYINPYAKSWDGKKVEII